MGRRRMCYQAKMDINNVGFETFKKIVFANLLWGRKFRFFFPRSTSNICVFKSTKYNWAQSEFRKENGMRKMGISLLPSKTAFSQHEYINVWSAFLRVAGGCLWGWSAHTAAGTADRRTPPAHQRTPVRSSPLTEEGIKGSWENDR